MFAILATNIVGSKLGYCAFDLNVAAPASKYGVNETAVKYNLRFINFLVC